MGKYFFLILFLSNQHHMSAQLGYKLISDDTLDYQKLSIVSSEYKKGYNIFEDVNNKKYILVPQYDRYVLEFSEYNELLSFINGDLELSVHVPEYMYLEREKIHPDTFLKELPGFLSRLKVKLNIQKRDFAYNIESAKLISDILFPIPDGDEELLFLLSVFANEVFRKETNKKWRFEKIYTLRPFYKPLICDEKNMPTGVRLQTKSTDFLYQINNAISMDKTREVLIPDFERIIEASKKNKSNE